MRVCISIGNYATTPYVIPGIEIPVYCIEEMCYLLGENAVLLDQTIMTRSMALWIIEECGLRSLGEELINLVQRQGSLSTFVCTILEYTGLQDYYYIEGVRGKLDKGKGLSSIERHKKQIDYLVEKKRYQSAVRGYNGLIEKWDQVSQDKSSILPALNVLSAIYHNLGVAYAGLMLYEQAAEAFDKAYNLDGNKEHFFAYLAAMRMSMDEATYVDFSTRIAGSFNDALMLEKTMKMLQKTWNESGDANRLRMRAKLRDTEEASKYYAENEHMLKALKESYRENAIL